MTGLNGTNGTSAEPGQFRYRLGQFDLVHDREAGARFKRPPHANGDVPGRAFAGFDLSQVRTGLSHHVQQVVKFRIRRSEHGRSFQFSKQILFYRIYSHSVPPPRPSPYWGREKFLNLVFEAA